MYLELYATATGADMGLRRCDGVEHSQWPTAEEDHLEALLRPEVGRKVLPRQWSLKGLDAALDREYYRRFGNW